MIKAPTYSKSNRNVKAINSTSLDIKCKFVCSWALLQLFYRRRAVSFSLNFFQGGLRTCFCTKREIKIQFGWTKTLFLMLPQASWFYFYFLVQTNELLLNFNGRNSIKKICLQNISVETRNYSALLPYTTEKKLTMLISCENLLNKHENFLSTSENFDSIFFFFERNSFLCTKKELSWRHFAEDKTWGGAMSGNISGKIQWIRNKVWVLQTVAKCFVKNVAKKWNFLKVLISPLFGEITVVLWWGLKRFVFSPIFTLFLKMENKTLFLFSIFKTYLKTLIWKASMFSKINLTSHFFNPISNQGRGSTLENFSLQTIIIEKITGWKGITSWNYKFIRAFCELKASCFTYLLLFQFYYFEYNFFSSLYH